MGLLFIYMFVFIFIKIIYWKILKKKYGKLIIVGDQKIIRNNCIYVYICIYIFVSCINKAQKYDVLNMFVLKNLVQNPYNRISYILLLDKKDPKKHIFNY